jgi:hypothetical protein
MQENGIDSHWYSTVDKYTAKKIRYIYSQKGNCALVPNSYIHVSVSDLYISTIGPPILLQQNRQHNRQTDRGNI